MDQFTEYFTKMVYFNTILRQANIYKLRENHSASCMAFNSHFFALFNLSCPRRPTRFTKKTVHNCLNDSHINWQRGSNENTNGLLT